MDHRPQRLRGLGEAVAHLKKRGYQGVVCLPAEYTDEENVDIYTREDLAYIKSLFQKEG